MTTTCSGGPSRAVLWMRQPTQQHHPGADGIDAGREPLVRQRLPGREHRDCVAENAAQLSRKVVGLSTGSGDHQQRALPGQRAGHEQARAGRSDQRQFPRSVGRQVDESLQRRRA